MSKSASIIGVDLTWGEKKPDGVTVIVFGDGIESAPTEPPRSFLTKGDEELLSVISSVDGSGWVLAAVDAPLICPNDSGAREVDRQCAREFGRYHAGAHSANRRLCRRPVRIGEALLGRGYLLTTDLSRGAFLACEVYPHPATILLFGWKKTLRYKRGRVADRAREFELLKRHLRTSLDREVPWMRESESTRALLDSPWSKKIEDLTDSILCALVGYLHLRHSGSRSRVLGDDETGHMLLPLASEAAKT